MKNASPWGLSERESWFKDQTIKRSYLKKVIPEIEQLKSDFEVTQYGALSISPNQYPVLLVKSKEFNPNKKTIVITGGVHGYETSGVHGAIAFIKQEALKYSDKFNFICAPCISPWAYETINRWNAKAIDPNRSFFSGSPAEECEFFLNAMKPFMNQIYAHFDLHETTDTDNTVFRPAKALRDGKPEEEWTEIPDGFYVVGDTENPTPAFLKAVIESVRKVTHIAPADKDGKIIGEPIVSEGVINYPLQKLYLCAGFSKAKYTATTEVYPDSPKVNEANCVDAQIAAITGGLDFLKGLR